MTRLALVLTWLSLLSAPAWALGAADAGGPQDPAEHFRQSQAHATAGRPAEALAAIDRALEARPDDPEYLQAAATIATWLGDYPRALGYYRRLQRTQTDPAALLLPIGRVQAWNGDTDAAASSLRDFTRTYPQSAEGWLTLARIETWRGAHGRALDALREHARHLGRSADWSLAVGRALTAASRPYQAARMLEPLAAAGSTGYEPHLLLAIGAAETGNVPASRRALVEALRRDAPASEARTAGRLIRRMTGSSFEPTMSYYTDSDDLEVLRAGATATLVLPTSTRLAGGYGHDTLRAAAGSGLEADAPSVERRTLWVGAEQRIGWLTAAGRAGLSSSIGRDIREYTAGIRAAGDAVRVGIEHRRGVFAVSPRTVALGLTSTQQALAAEWRPTPEAVVQFDATVEAISDGNERTALAVSARRGVVRRARFNLDLGVSAQRVGASLDLDHGYYDPARYERYALLIAPYFKVHDAAGVAVWVGVGAHRQRPDRFEPAADGRVELSVGIYRAWMLQVAAAVTNNRRMDSGAYRGTSGSASLVRRF